MQTTINPFDTLAKIDGALALIEATPFDVSEPLVAAVRMLRAARAEVEEVAE